MVSIFEASNYRIFIQKRFHERPKRGYGQAHKLAVYLGVHTTLISQVLKGLKSFTLEQAAGVSDFLGLNEMESEFFLLLVQLDRAGSESLKKILRRQIQALRQKSSEIAARLPSAKLSDEKRAIFYSDWTYAAVRQLTALPEYQTMDAMAERLGLSLRQVKGIVDFLLSAGLCKEERGRLAIGPSRTHLEASSPWVRVHHTNWRQKAIQQMKQEEEAQLHYTSPMTLAKADAVRIREMIIQFLEKVDQVMDPSPSEELHCLNIDWFKV